MSRILIVAPSWVGDMVMAQSLVAVLRAKEPEAEIDLLAPSWSAVLGSRMPGVRATVAIDTAHHRFDFVKRVLFGRTLRRAGYDRAIVLPGSWKSALVPYFAGIGRRTGYRGEMRYGLLNDVRTLDKVKLPRTVDRFVALAAGPGEALPEVPLPVLSHDRLRGWVIAEKFGLTRGKLVALCPGAEYGPAKQWPATHFAALADILHRQGFQTFLLGSKKDSAISEEIRGQVAMRSKDAMPVNLSGKTTIPEAIDLLTLTAGVVSNDSGLMHVAAAIGRPLIALYGSTVSSINPPLTRHAVVLERTLPCRPCFQRTCPLGHLDCLNLIGAAEVAERLQSEVAPAA